MTVRQAALAACRVTSKGEKHMEKKYVLEFKDIRKSFSGVQVLNDISFSVERGKVHALLGENGAGKSTLMKILSGAYTKDGGTISFDGKEIAPKNTNDSEKLGISIIYQELNLIPEISIAENIYLHRQPEKYGFVDWKKMNRMAKEMLEKVGLKLKPQELVGRLTVAQQQMAEIAKALSKDLKLLIMDEPTSSLTDAETKTLFGLIGSLKEKGITIIYISHRMNEIFEICDSYTVMRDGSVIQSGQLQDTNLDELIKNMVGHDMSQVFPKHQPRIGEEVLRAEHISNGAEVKEVSFYLKKGEILGFAGLMGAGRTETFKAIFGYDSRRKGDIYVKGEKVNIRSPKDAIRCGLGYVPEDRRREGLVTSLPVVDNIVMVKMENAMKKGFYSASKAKEISSRFISSLMIKTTGIFQKCKFLSGGNQQKVVLAKWLNCDSDILILDEPTRGIDINAKSEIYQMIVDLAESGKSVIVISSELPEVIGLCDRVYVMYEGRITGQLDREELDQESIMHYAMGGN